MGKFAWRNWICSACFAAAVLGAGSGVAAAGKAGGQPLSDSAVDNLEPPSDVTQAPADDLGGTPSAVESLSPGSAEKPNLGPVQNDQVKARNAVERGEAQPFGWLLRKLKRAVPGDIVKVRLKRNGEGLWIYDVTVLNSSGRYAQVSLNAATGAIISTRYR